MTTTADLGPTAQNTANTSFTNYEFNEDEEQLFAHIGGRMTRSAWLTAAHTTLVALWMIFSVRFYVITLPMAILFGIFTAITVSMILRSARAFTKVASTQGDDISHTVQAVGGLIQLYGWQNLWLWIGIGANAFLLVLAVASH